ncbi:hypothetical protein TD95_003014 [Thielaviopsis punctulata]|uniref:Uncharacterized protein n=1 Tax=Thielaviopsis punctulata TaxID=72032 RepID=A0A0F4ZDJ9_9PEZI|nr:hypothetical protein TD95_003014 [Thielaviopsis punctulata]
MPDHDELSSPTETDSINSLQSTFSTPQPRPERFSSALDFASSHTDLPYRASRKSLTASLYASTLSPPGSRSISPARRGTPSVAGSIFETGRFRQRVDSSIDTPGDPLNLIVHSFIPHIAVYTSQDTDDLLQTKGLEKGFWELLRPFGEQVQGKVTIRDSHAGSHAYDNYSVRFTQFGQDIETPLPPSTSTRISSQRRMSNPGEIATKKAQIDMAHIETVVTRHLEYAEESFKASPHPDLLPQDTEFPSPYYTLYLRRLLAQMRISSHETFAHPVACVMAISSRNQSPIEELRRLYQNTSQGDKKLPEWVDSDYLRYYVLVHDEDNDDIQRSMALFEQMKRHLGPHCHLLRIRGVKACENDEDTIPLPRCEWMTAAEELETMGKDGPSTELDKSVKYLYESDVVAIRGFVREMVVQSVIPTMERHVMVWNDQVASRRRGITGRFITLSKKWPFGGGSSKSTSGSSILGNNYDSTGYYTPETQEAILRKLADFAFMLRDWKLAYSTYDILRTDYNEAKAWKHYAAANEMAAVSLLMMPQSLSSKSRVDTVDQMLEAAFYSYNTRCNSPTGAIRALILGLELLRPRGGSSVDDAARWGTRLLDSKLLGQIGEALINERIAICYASKRGVGTNAWGRRNRKSALWNLVAAERWASQDKPLQAWRCLEACNMIYASNQNKGIYMFNGVQAQLDNIGQFLKDALGMANVGGIDVAGGDGMIDEESEVLDTTVPTTPGLTTISESASA